MLAERARPARSFDERSPGRRGPGIGQPVQFDTRGVSGLQPSAQAMPVATGGRHDIASGIKPMAQTCQKVFGEFHELLVNRPRSRSGKGPVYRLLTRVTKIRTNR